MKFALSERQGGKCALCGQVLSASGVHVDHIVPRKYGGKNHQQNLQLVCARCNLKKGGKLNPTEAAA
jgi:5-methylcytosine-specific restriction endonuclease McrA